jgi:hypothetical protein
MTAAKILREFELALRNSGAPVKTSYGKAQHILRYR